MRGLLLGCIADDFTGATDLANALTRRGMWTGARGRGARRPAIARRRRDRDRARVTLGPVVAGSSLDAAVNAIEELEQTAKLGLLLKGHPTRYLTAQQVAELNRRFNS